MTEPIIGPGPNDYGREKPLTNEEAHAAVTRSVMGVVAQSVKDLAQEIREMRLALCIAHAGMGAYLDNSAHPCIDWKRDTWEVIKAKLVERGRRVLEEAERARQEGLKKLQAEIDAGAVKIEDLSPESADLVIAENRRKLEAEGVLPVTDADLKRFGL